MFDDWTDEQFNAWLAGFFDGEGCIYIPKVPGIALSIANTDPAIIDAIHRRLGLGLVTEVEYEQPGWKNKFSWSVRNYAEAEMVLRRIRPYLTIKAPKADQAFALIESKMKRWQEIADRNATIAQWREEGVSASEIARRVGLCRQRVNQILMDLRREPGDRSRAGDGPRRFVSHFIKPSVTPRTTAKKLP